MGCGTSKCVVGDKPNPQDLRGDLDPGMQRAILRRGRSAVLGRYHRLPQKLEDEYSVESESILGTGYNGPVHIARYKRTQAAYAVKSFRLKGASGNQALMLRREAEIYLAMDHPNIARLVDVYEGSQQLDLVMECMTGGELFDRIQQMGKFSEADTARALSQMLRAVSYLHSHGVVHRDLKLQNFLYERPDSDHLKLIDFGFSQLWTPEDTRMKAFVGTLSYMAPEVLHFRAAYCSQCDLWSLGVLTFILLTGRMPFSGPEPEQIREIKAGNWMKKKIVNWAALSWEAKEFVEKLLTVDPQARMTALDALTHPFITEGSPSNRDRAATEVQPEIVAALVGFSKASNLRRAVMEVMAWSLSSDEQAAVREQFMAIDTNCQGTITMAELRTALMAGGVSEDLVLPIFQALDGAKDEEIHYSEFLAAMVSTRIVVHEDLLKTTFRRFDTEASGYITVENLKEMLGDSFDGVPIEELLKEADYLKDNRISYDEFVEYLIHSDIQSRSANQGMRNTALGLIDQQIENAGDENIGNSIGQYVYITPEIKNLLQSSMSCLSPRQAPSTKKRHSKVKPAAAKTKTHCGEWLKLDSCCMSPLLALVARRAPGKQVS